jgi:hypothetical protein
MLEIQHFSGFEPQQSCGAGVRVNKIYEGGDVLCLL